MILKIDVSDFKGIEGSSGLDIPALESKIGSCFASKDLMVCDVARVALTFVSKTDIKYLNSMYRDVPEPTDVLSFPLWEEDGVFSPPPWREELPLGDVVVSPEFVRDNAGSGKIAYDGEMVLVVIHGILHLVGFDHDTEERRIAMWDLQERLRDSYFSGRSDEDWED
ncbi:MAG: rRNA maturation RNase YbeY [Synergistaceae bacterium]|nr:rRNA maturation RNase YbeY [Synergistaceae bacterium]